MQEQIVNRVAKSGIVTIDLGDYYPDSEIVVFDIKDWLFQGLILREKDFREQVEAHDWSAYAGKYVSLWCSADAIVPLWAYMLLTTRLQPVAKKVGFGDKDAFLALHYQQAIDKIEPEEYTDKRVVIKGCGEKEVPAHAFTAITARLLPFAKTIMYGEPCSTVPVYKKPKG